MMGRGWLGKFRKNSYLISDFIEVFDEFVYTFSVLTHLGLLSLSSFSNPNRTGKKPDGSLETKIPNVCNLQCPSELMYN